MPPKKKGKKGKKSSEPVLTGPEAEAEMERKLLIEEAKALKRQKELQEVQFGEYQQEKVRQSTVSSFLLSLLPFFLLGVQGSHGRMSSAGAGGAS